MSLVDEFKKASAEVLKMGPVCSICALFDTLSDEDSKALKKELGRDKTDPKYLNSRQIADVLERNNLGSFPQARILRCRKGHHGSR